MLRSISLLLFLSLSITTFGQRNIVSSGPMLQDKFPKKSGSLRASKFSINLGRIKNNEVKYDTLFLLNEGLQPISFTVYMHNASDNVFPAHLKITPKDTVLMPGKESYLAIRYDAAKIDDYGFVLDRCVLMTTDLETPSKQFSITAFLIEDFPAMTAEDSAVVQKASVPVTIVDYRTVQAGRKVSRSVMIYNNGKKDLLIHKAKSNGPGIDITFSKNTVPAGDSSQVNIEFSTFGKIGVNNRLISIFMNDPAMPEVKIQLNGTVAEGKKD